jgi:hypothetical protein
VIRAVAREALASHRLWRDAARPSKVVLPVLRGRLS